MTRLTSLVSLAFLTAWCVQSFEWQCDSNQCSDPQGWGREACCAILPCDVGCYAPYEATNIGTCHLGLGTHFDCCKKVYPTAAPPTDAPVTTASPTTTPTTTTTTTPTTTTTTSSNCFQNKAVCIDYGNDCCTRHGTDTCAEGYKTDWTTTICRNSDKPEMVMYLYSCCGDSVPSTSTSTTTTPSGCFADKHHCTDGGTKCCAVHRKDAKCVDNFKPHFAGTCVGKDGAKHLAFTCCPED